MVTMPGFAELMEVSPSDVWKNEEQQFTPWMIQQTNLDKLAHAIGLPTIVLVDREVQQGNLRADIIAHAPQKDLTVLIENQLYPADFEHFGRLMAYLEAFKAQVVVWVAASFGQEQLAAFRWLNENTNEPFSFFAVQLKVFRIGDSMATQFEVLERPNEWTHQVRAMQETGGAMTGLRKVRNGFWSIYAHRYPDDLHLPPLPTSASYSVSIGNVSASLSLSVDGVGIYLTNRDGYEGVEGQRFLEACQAALSERGVKSWDTVADAYREENWPKMADQLHQKLLQHQEVIDALAAESDQPVFEAES